MSDLADSAVLPRLMATAEHIQLTDGIAVNELEALDVFSVYGPVDQILGEWWESASFMFGELQHTLFLTRKAHLNFSLSRF
jgi:hypothetical protein